MIEFLEVGAACYKPEHANCCMIPCDDMDASAEFDADAMRATSGRAAANLGTT